MTQPRSIIFYAWALLAAQLALVGGVIAVVLVGGARQQADLTDLYTRAQAAQVTNLTMVDSFLSAQRLARSYQATGDLALLNEYGTGKLRFFTWLTRLEHVAGADTAGLGGRAGAPRAGRLLLR